MDIPAAYILSLRGMNNAKHWKLALSSASKELHLHLLLLWGPFWGVLHVRQRIVPGPMTVHILSQYLVGG